MGSSIHTQDEYIEIWAPSSTPEDVVQAAIACYRASGRPTVIYRSGTGSLSALTAELLKYNLSTHSISHP